MDMVNEFLRLMQEAEQDVLRHQQEASEAKAMAKKCRADMDHWREAILILDPDYFKRMADAVVKSSPIRRG